MEQSLKSMAATYGIYLAILLSSVTIIAYVINLELLTSMWVGIILFIIIIGFGIFSTAKAKRSQNGFISFKDAFTAYFATVVVGVIISAIVSIILFNYIDPDAAEALKLQVIENSTKMMKSFGAPQEAIDQAVADMQDQNQFEIGNQIKSLAFQIIFYCVVGLIVALAMKKTDPEAN
ncbi:DUF4199 domain-containing protein [Formosa sediminum]|uniref:DUF4199 domain-containing protein n=1 Tax=Formosa sediminum TaxID=2594004 RepID=A0A516GRI2_9FLAO|nr:DUF4199 domain-containing protein [Formosa sediminum]QDO94126.1 DUF4199 domain-containing protein [Formosa sediminum]